MISYSSYGVRFVFGILFFYKILMSGINFLFCFVFERWKVGFLELCRVSEKVMDGEFYGLVEKINIFESRVERMYL